MTYLKISVFSDANSGTTNSALNFINWSFLSAIAASISAQKYFRIHMPGLAMKISNQSLTAYIHILSGREQILAEILMQQS